MVISQKYDCPRNAELLGQVACRGEPVTGREGAGQNSLPKAKVNLAEERLALSQKWYCQLHKKWIYENTTR
jgi:hypothetical protein